MYRPNKQTNLSGGRGRRGKRKKSGKFGRKHNNTYIYIIYGFSSWDFVFLRSLLPISKCAQNILTYISKYLYERPAAGCSLLCRAPSHRNIIYMSLSI